MRKYIVAVVALLVIVAVVTYRTAQSVAANAVAVYTYPWGTLTAQRTGGSFWDPEWGFVSMRAGAIAGYATFPSLYVKLSGTSVPTLLANIHRNDFARPTSLAYARGWIPDLPDTAVVYEQDGALFAYVSDTLACLTLDTGGLHKGGPSFAYSMKGPWVQFTMSEYEVGLLFGPPTVKRSSRLW